MTSRLLTIISVGAALIAAPALAEPAAAPEMERLFGAIGGTWSTAVTYERTSATPQGGMGSGRETARPGPGRRSMIVETRSNGPAGPFEALGVINWSAEEQAYKLHWFTSANPKAAIFSGRWQGRDLVFEGREMMGGQELASRHAVIDLAANSFGYTIDMGPAADRLERVLTIRYTRDTAP